MTAAPWSVSLFAVIFLLVESKKVPRNTGMVAGAILMLLLGWILDFYTTRDALSAVYFDTLALIFGMSLVGDILVRSGLFNLLATQVASYARGNAQLILVLLILITYTFSLVVNNLGTMLIILPLTLALCKTIRLDPVPIIIAEIIASNLGGASTLIGDFPNMIIGAAGKLHFDDFISGMMAPCLMMLAILLGYFSKFYTGKRVRNVELTTTTFAVSIVIERYLLQLGITILVVMLLVLAFAYPLGLRPGTITFIAGMIILVWGRVPQETLFNACSGDDIIFFAALFIMVGGLQAAGVLTTLHELIFTWGGKDLTLSLILLMLISALITPFLNAGPATALLIPVVAIMNREFPGNQVWWALSLGVLVGSSAALSGATAGPVVASQMLHQLDEDKSLPQSVWILDAKRYRALGIPIAVLFLIFVMLYIVIGIL